MKIISFINEHKGMNIEAHKKEMSNDLMRF